MDGGNKILLKQTDSSTKVTQSFQIEEITTKSKHRLESLCYKNSYLTTQKITSPAQKVWKRHL